MTRISLQKASCTIFNVLIMPNLERSQKQVWNFRNHFIWVLVPSPPANSMNICPCPNSSFEANLPLRSCPRFAILWLSNPGIANPCASHEALPYDRFSLWPLDAIETAGAAGVLISHGNIQTFFWLGTNQKFGTIGGNNHNFCSPQNDWNTHAWRTVMPLGVYTGFPSRCCFPSSSPSPPVSGTACSGTSSRGVTGTTAVSWRRPIFGRNVISKKGMNCVSSKVGSYKNCGVLLPRIQAKTNHTNPI